MAARIRLQSLRILAMGGIAVAGLGMVISALVLMNRPVEQPDRQERASRIDFTVPQEAPEPPEPEPEPRQRPTPRSNRPALAPVPNLGSNLSGIQVGLPEFQARGVDQVDESLLGDVENVALTEDTVDNPPIPPRGATVPYPERAKQRQIEGRVVVNVKVGTDGEVQNLRVLQAEPPGVFEQVVRSTVSNWTFQPATYQGQPVATWARLELPFRLN